MAAEPSCIFPVILWVFYCPVALNRLPSQGSCTVDIRASLGSNRSRIRPAAVLFARLKTTCAAPRTPKSARQDAHPLGWQTAAGLRSGLRTFYAPRAAGSYQRGLGLFSATAMLVHHICVAGADGSRCFRPIVSPCCAFTRQQQMAVRNTLDGLKSDSQRGAHYLLHTVVKRLCCSLGTA